MTLLRRLKAVCHPLTSESKSTLLVLTSKRRRRCHEAVATSFLLGRFYYSIIQVVFQALFIFSTSDDVAGVFRGLLLINTSSLKDQFWGYVLRTATLLLSEGVDQGNCVLLSGSIQSVLDKDSFLDKESFSCFF